jgi:hypothetical protein
MGYSLTSLKNLPKHLNYYFFLIGDYSNTSIINNFFREEFNVIASRLGEDAGIIQQTRKSRIEEELNEAISKHQYKGTKVSIFFYFISSQYPGLLILNKHPDDLTDKDMIIHIPFSTLREVYSDTDELLDDLVGFTKGGKQLMIKINRYIRIARKVISGLSFGVNVGIFSINYQLEDMV